VGKGNGIVGETDFVDWIKEGFLRGDRSKREQPALRHLRKAFEPEELIEHFVHLSDMDKEEVCKRGKNSQRQPHHQKIYNELKDQLTELSRIKI
jgi:hypothetical protein